MRACGTRLIDRDQGALLKLGEGVAHFAGIQTCGSPHGCAVCAAKIASGRVEEVVRMVRQAEAEGMGVFLGSWTFSHHRGERLEALLAVQQRAWHLMTQRRGFVRLRERFGLEWVRRVEMTWWAEGGNGWHPHFHAAVFTKRPLEEEDREVLEAALTGEWLAALESVGRSALASYGFTLRAWDGGEELADYLNKQGVPSVPRARAKSPEALGLEVAGAPYKRGRQDKGLTPWDLLDWAVDGDAEAYELWCEYEAATQGRRTTNLSAGAQALRKRAAVVERSDEELAAAEVGGEVVLGLRVHGWAALTRHSYRGAALIEACERSVAEALAYVREHLPPGGWWLPASEGVCDVETG